MLCMILFINSELERKSSRSLVKRQHDKAKLIKSDIFTVNVDLFIFLNMSL